ncbi:MAG: carbamoyltransferase HypF [Desulfobacteraceae bacterium]
MRPEVIPRPKSPMEERIKGAVQGIVQGVGFRPFVYRLATQHALSGYVTNTPTGVDIEVQGPENSVRRFMESLTAQPPPLAHIASVQWEAVPLRREDAFHIYKSRADEERSALISPDVCICEDCLREMRDPSNRRFGYPFINCTNCGPRYTIIKDIPYDRSHTTMQVFTMCPECQAEYEDPGDRRFHAQPNACWKCGPRMTLHDAKGSPMACADPVSEGLSFLKKGAILAIKGLGGFHLAVDALNHGAVVRLRKRKHREEKPLAVMVKKLDDVYRVAHVTEEEAALLTSRERPIVLLQKRHPERLCSQIAPQNSHIGIMLPYTPMHNLLMDRLSREAPLAALVMTSGNKTEEPINTRNQDAFKNLYEIADYFLTHNRGIYLRADDSVMKVIDHVPRQIRRARGYVPRPLFLSAHLTSLPSVLAVGGELKNTICLTKENRAFVSQHIGNMENVETLNFFHLTIDHLKRILEIEPEVVVHDLHPDYLSSKFARHEQKAPVLAVQHHHAHVVGCLAEHGLEGPVMGVALDGTGLGTDGCIWGGEILVCDLVSFERKAHFAYVSLPGGDAAARYPWRTALSYLYEAFHDELFNLPIPFVQKLDRRIAELILRMVQKGVNSPCTSSCGRLFDAIASLIGLRDQIAYEGQAAVELEMCQSHTGEECYPYEIKQEGTRLLMCGPHLIKEVVHDLCAGTPQGVISRRFHNTMIRMVADACARVGKETGVERIALSGGSFQNMTLLTGLTRLLRLEGFEVYSHVQVPTNDGGLSLGQAICGGLTYSGRKGKFQESYEIH